MKPIKFKAYLNQPKFEANVAGNKGLYSTFAQKAALILNVKIFLLFEEEIQSYSSLHREVLNAARKKRINRYSNFSTRKFKSSVSLLGYFSAEAFFLGHGRSF